MTFDSKDKIEICENAISWIIVFAMLVYGVGKIVQFKEQPKLIRRFLK